MTTVGICSQVQMMNLFAAHNFQYLQICCWLELWVVHFLFAWSSFQIFFTQIISYIRLIWIMHYLFNLFKWLWPLLLNDRWQGFVIFYCKIFYYFDDMHGLFVDYDPFISEKNYYLQFHFFHLHCSLAQPFKFRC